MSVHNFRQRHGLPAVRTAAPTKEQRAQLARDFAVRHAIDESTRYEQERAARIEQQLQADALLHRIRAAGEVGCAEPEPLPSLAARLIQRIRNDLRQEFGAVWPAWAALYGLFAVGGIAGFVMVVKAWTEAQP